MQRLEFDVDTHQYRVDGSRVWSVTQIISEPLKGAALARIPPDVLQRKAEIGTATHKAVQASLAGQLDWLSLDPDVEPYFNAWSEFFVRHDWRPTIIEEPMYSTRYRYAGTPDQVGHLDGEPAVLDLKTVYAMDASIGVQLAAYEQLILENRDEFNVGAQFRASKLKRFGLQLRKDGGFRVHHYQNRLDWPCFQALLTINAWKLSH